MAAVKLTLLEASTTIGDDSDDYGIDATSGDITVPATMKGGRILFFRRIDQSYNKAMINFTSPHTLEGATELCLCSGYSLRINHSGSG